jgi:hypothetical protein
LPSDNTPNRQPIFHILRHRRRFVFGELDAPEFMTLPLAQKSSGYHGKVSDGRAYSLPPSTRLHLLALPRIPCGHSLAAHSFDNRHKG